MKKQRKADVSEVKTPSLQAYDDVVSLVSDAYHARATCRPQKIVDTACTAEAELIQAVIAARDLDEMIALELRLQTSDREKYARSANEKQRVEQGLADLRSGMHMYAMLKHDSGQYKNAAKGFTDSNRDMRLNVPRDGMRYALASQRTRLQNRESLQLSDDEKSLLSVRRALLSAIAADYSALQAAVLHGKGNKK